MYGRWYWPILSISRCLLWRKGGPKYGYFGGKNRAAMAGLLWVEDPAWKPLHLCWGKGNNLAMQCFHKGLQLQTWAACGPNWWNGAHLGRISLKRPHFTWTSCNIPMGSVLGSFGAFQGNIWCAAPFIPVGDQEGPQILIFSSWKIFHGPTSPDQYQSVKWS